MTFYTHTLRHSMHSEPGRSQSALSMLLALNTSVSSILSFIPTLIVMPISMVSTLIIGASIAQPSII